ncbi:hypothetical protein O7635_32920 [Asanoa sp. WMMD1127]|uniref:hypothetical protein n=1 Tax=Asanoa sp. WMMD1127 TaxID=3016107 RepID=UPI0024161645|nr:hypothetical protein [Asanoa sp. WMMD1127]MDG4826677.1 hypothetical protein [Asanoa sp. WMMD1127]
MSREAWILVIVVGALLALGSLIGAIVLGVRVVRVRNQLGTLGFGGKVAFYGALVFTIFPVDVLPDPIYLDDMGVLGLALLYLNGLLRRRQERLPRTLPPLPRTPAPQVPRKRGSPGR